MKLTDALRSVFILRFAMLMALSDSTALFLPKVESHSFLTVRPNVEANRPGTAGRYLC